MMHGLGSHNIKTTGSGENNTDGLFTMTVAYLETSGLTIPVDIIYPIYHPPNTQCKYFAWLGFLEPQAMTFREMNGVIS